MNFKQQTKSKNLQKVLSIAVAALNTANVLSPLAVPYTAMAKEVHIDYQQIATAGEQAVQVLDNLMFSTAEAAYTTNVSGSVDGETIDSGIQTIKPGGQATNTTIDGSGAWQHISSGGQAVNTTINAGVQNVSSGGQAVNTVVNSGLQQIFSDGRASNTTINSNGWQVVSNGGQTSDVIIENGGRQQIVSGGQTLNVTMNVGGWQYVGSGAQAVSTTVNGGLQVVSSGGQVSATTLNGGNQFVDSTGQAIDTVVNAGTQTIGKNGLASNTVINGGTQTVSSDGQATDTTINGGVQHISAGAQAIKTTINNYGDQIVEAGLATNTNITGGRQHLWNGGQATDTILSDKGAQFVQNQGIATSTTINSESTQLVLDGGIANNTIVNSDGVQYVGVGGQTSNTIVNAHGTHDIVGGHATNVTINEDGYQMIQNGGQATSTTIEGGEQVLFNFGAANYTYIGNGGIQRLQFDGQATNTTVNSGGTQLVEVGGTAIDTTINEGGTSTVGVGGIYAGQTINHGLLILRDYNQTTGLNLSGNNGVVDIIKTQPSYNNNVTINTLQGSQIFHISADLANNTADMITITDSATGTHYIKVDKEATHGSEISNLYDGHKAQVVATPGGDVVFKGMQSAIDGVHILPNVVQEGSDWYLAGYRITGASDLAYTATAAGNMAYAALFSADNNSLQQRMGDIRENINNAGVWVRMDAGELAVQGDSMRHNSFQGGYDRAVTTQHGKAASGIMLEHFNASSSYEAGSGKLKNTRLGLYHLWLGDSGHYYDIVLKTGKLRNSFSSHEEEVANAAYSTWNTSISAEYGYKKQLRKGYYLTPMAKISFGRINAASYNTDKDTAISQDAINSLVLRAGIGIGRKVGQTSWYANAAVVSELTATNKVTTGHGVFAATEEQSFKGTGLELGLGSNINIGKSSNLYFDLTRSFGGKVTNKWRGQLGYRYSF